MSASIGFDWKRSEDEHESTFAGILLFAPAAMNEALLAFIPGAFGAQL